jgi:DNA polymerase III sliding clamp (beta) subunit (PCNA family)
MEGRLVLSSGSTTLAVPLIPAQYPDLDKLFPDGFATTITADVELLQAATRRAMIMASDSTGSVLSSVQISTAVGALTVQGRDHEAGLSLDEIDVEMEGEDIDFRVPGEKLIQILEHIRTESVLIFIANSNPMKIVVKETGSPKAAFLIMPMA